MFSKLLVQLLAVGGLVNESEYRLLDYCNIELLFLMSFTKCDASTKHDAILDGIGKNISMYKHRTFTGVLLRTSTLHRYLHRSPRKLLEAFTLKLRRNPPSD